MTVALALVFGGYVVFVLAAAVQVWRQPTPPLLPDAELPDAVVVIAARDEEATIERCLRAVLAQDYPADRLTIVVADDHSSDGTAAIVQAVAATEPSVRYLRVPDPEGPLRGKAQALHVAIAATDAPMILITDADCAPVETWARALASQLSEPDRHTGIACGLARVVVRPDRWFDRVQALDWELLLGLMSAVAESGAPAAGMGNDMGITRAAYESTGGYPALPFSVTEDFALIQAVAAAGWEVRFPVDPRAVVWSLPVDGPRGTYEQRRRWARGGLGDPWVLVVYALAFAVHALLVAGLVVAPPAGLAALAAKGGADGIGLAVIRRRVGGRVGLVPLAATTLFMVGYLVTLPVVLALRPEIGWKGRRH
ncbi:glycosyltransferase [Rubrivirga sp. IMCC45206]|uniref:glycosyltransferase n=1 Tax=Rubrivirga sp. IMCC45206 TaxID=3391614 RepID=UPI0039901AD7